MFKKFLQFENVFTILALIHFSGGGLPLYLSGGFSEGEGASSNVTNPINASVFILIYVITLSLLTLRWKRGVSAILKNKMLAALAVVILLSFLWSLNPITTLVESIRIVASTLFGLYFATRFSSKEQISLLSITFYLVLILSILAAILPPHYGIMGGVHMGAFRGIYVHKNQFGMTMAIGSLSLLIQAFSRGRTSKVFYVAYSLSVMLVLLSRSTAAIGVTMMLFILYCIFCSHIILRWRYLIMIPGLLFLSNLSIWGGVFVANNLGLLTEVTGKDTTLTGRTTFWPVLLDMVAQKPWLGYGISGFWNGLNGPSRQVIQTSMWELPEAHNGFIELALSLGIVGLGLFFASYFINLLRAVWTLKRRQSVESVWPILYLTFIVLANLTESSLLESGFIWLLYVSVCCSLPIHFNQSNSQPSLSVKASLMQAI